MTVRHSRVALALGFAMFAVGAAVAQGPAATPRDAEWPVCVLVAAGGGRSREPSGGMFIAYRLASTAQTRSDVQRGR